jgi:hypothetical protein
MPLVNQCDICGAIYKRYPDEKNMVITTKAGRHAEWTDICCPKCTERLKEVIDILKTPGIDYELRLSQKPIR